MPRVLIKESNFNQLEQNIPYTLIIRKHSLVFKQITDDSTLKNIFIVKIEPLQVRKFLLQEKNKEYSMYLEFVQNNESEEEMFFCRFDSLELPITVLFDKLMKIIDPNYEEKNLLEDGTKANVSIQEEQSRNTFLEGMDAFIKNTQSLVTQPITKGIKLIQLGMNGLEKSFRNGIQGLTSQFNKKEQGTITKELPVADFEPTEFLIQINKIYLNHIDSALQLQPEKAEESKNGLILVDQGIEDENELKKDTVVFIHPFGLDIAIWKPYFTYFYNKNYRIIAFDMRGWGGSEQQKNDDYKFSDYYNDFTALLEEKQLLQSENELVIVTGSLTGLMLLNKVDGSLQKRKNMKLVLLSSTDRIEKDLQEMIKKIPPPRTWGPLKKVGRGKIKSFVLTKDVITEEQDILINKLLSADNRVVNETAKNLKSDYINGLNEKQMQSLPFEKILLVSGERDVFIPIKNLKPFESNKNATIKVIEGGNHFIAFERPDVVLKEIDLWL